MTARELKIRILEAARETPSPTRRTMRREGGLALAGSGAVLLAFFFALDGPEHGLGRPLWFCAATSLGWASVAAVSMWVALARGPFALGRSRAWLLAMTVGTPAVLFAMMFAFVVLHPEGKLVHPERLGAKCLALTIAAGAPPLMALATWRRGSAPVHPVASGTALGVACGSLAGVMVAIWCPVVTLAHIALGHILPIGVMGIVGALVASRILAMPG
ncbi:NrsF family protein [Pendulispora albinea]|uniref:NrsF family protein n=1 Tax=Pendulispora albinea TaxID=2741071 RepID=A0ABZ2LUN5_9BACT